MASNPIKSTVDLDREGTQHGFLKLPHSDDSAAWGAIMIPISVFKNGAGPTVLITGANHGDEYEGPVALLKLANEINADTIRGRIILVPMMNYPAFRAGRRVSPIDQGNMNRMFPGRPDGTVTEKIADFFNQQLLPMADYVLDIHSGGKTLNFVPFAAAHILQDKAQQARCEAAMLAFGAPYSVMLLEQDADSMYDTAAERQGKVFISTELGGGGSTTPFTNQIARQGVLNLIAHAGLTEAVGSPAPSRRIEMPDGDCYVISDESGLLEMTVELGEHTAPGQLVARIYDVERSGVPAAEFHASRGGILIGRHHPGLIKPGDTIAVIGVP